MSLVCHLYVTSMYSYAMRMSLICNRMSLVCSCMSSVCHSYILACHPYVIRISLACHPYVTCMYSYVIHISLVYTPMSSVCHSYVLACRPYVTRMYSYVIRMSLGGFWIILKRPCTTYLLQIYKVFCKTCLLKLLNKILEKYLRVIFFSKVNLLNNLLVKLQALKMNSSTRICQVFFLKL